MLPRQSPLGERGLGLATSVLALGLRGFSRGLFGCASLGGPPCFGLKNPLRSGTLHTPPLRQPELGIPVVSKGGWFTSVRFLLLHEERSVSGDFGGSPPNNQPLVGSGLPRFRGWLEGHYSIQLQPSSQGPAPVDSCFSSVLRADFSFSFSLPVPSLCLLWRLSHGRCLLPASASAR